MGFDTCVEVMSDVIIMLRCDKPDAVLTVMAVTR
jgi:hypothetical protein